MLSTSYSESVSFHLEATRSRFPKCLSIDKSQEQVTRQSKPRILAPTCRLHIGTALPIKTRSRTYSTSLSGSCSAQVRTRAQERERDVNLALHWHAARGTLLSLLRNGIEISPALSAFNEIIKPSAECSRTEWDCRGFWGLWIATSYFSVLAFFFPFARCLDAVGV